MKGGFSSRWWGQAAALAICVFLGLAIGGTYQFGSPFRAVTYLRGYDLIAEKPSLSFGDLAPGQSNFVAFRLDNLTGRPVRVLHAKTSCSCTVVEDLPLEIPPHGSASLEIRVKARDEPGSWHEKSTYGLTRLARH